MKPTAHHRTDLTAPATPWPRVTGFQSSYRGELAARGAAQHRAALERLLAGSEPPCATEPEAWYPTTPEGVEQATDACMGCPALFACAAYADALAADLGVWGGTDRTVKRRTQP